MLALGQFRAGRPASRECWFHGLVLDGRGRKMSKSRGNVVTVGQAVGEHGADALRAALLAGCVGAEDVRFDPAVARRYARVPGGGRAGRRAAGRAGPGTGWSTGAGGRRGRAGRRCGRPWTGGTSPGRRGRWTGWRSVWSAGTPAPRERCAAPASARCGPSWRPHTSR